MRIVRFINFSLFGVFKPNIKKKTPSMSHDIEYFKELIKRKTFGHVI